MAYIKWKATRIFDGNCFADAGKMLVTTGEGTIIDWIDDDGTSDDSTRHVDGLLCPGFVNAHCHLELSHLKGHIPPRTGMVEFLQQVMAQQRFRPEEKMAAMREALREMRKNGIVAVGDISNNTDSIAAKQESDIYFHHFIEVAGFVPATMYQRWEAVVEVARAFLNAFPPEQVTITPHAPYSVSPVLLQVIQDHEAGKLLSLHLMESEDELAFFRDKQGDFMKLYAHLGIDLGFFEAPGVNPLRHLWPAMRQHRPWLWVHNTEVGLHDLEWLEQQGVNWHDIHFCLCPGANQYINYAMPALHRFRNRFPLQLCIGTDSLAGNYYLNPMYEMRLMQKQGRLGDLTYLLQMATLNGAKALGIQHRYGSFETGKTPGLLGIKGIEGDTLQPKTSVERLI